MNIAVVNWRDPWHPAAGGAETYAWEMARRFARAGDQVCFVTARAPGQLRKETVEGVRLARMGGPFTVYPLVLVWLVLRRRMFDAVLDCQNGIPFFTPLVLPRRTKVMCVVHHVHDRQFDVHLPRWLAVVGRFLEGPAVAVDVQGARQRGRLALDREGHARAARLGRPHPHRAQRGERLHRRRLPQKPDTAAGLRRPAGRAQHSTCCSTRWAGSGSSGRTSPWT